MLEPPRSYEGEPPSMGRLYFGHPINAYGTPFQAELIRRIAQTFPHWELFSPDGPEHDAAYKEYAKTHVDGDGKPTGMGYFFEEILPTCKGGVFLPFRDLKFGKGVYGEAAGLFERKFPVWEISPDGLILPIKALDASRCLTREETRERIRHADGSSKPY